LSVHGWDEPQVEITIIKSTGHFYKAGTQEEAKRRLENIRMVTRLRPPLSWAAMAVTRLL
jgi:hypothetical protein